MLTPTNKAADVLVNRIMEVYGNDTSCQEWLIRFGITGDERIEQSLIYKDKSFDIRADLTLPDNVRASIVMVCFPTGRITTS